MTRARLPGLAAGLLLFHLASGAAHAQGGLELKRSPAPTASASALCPATPRPPRAGTAANADEAARLARQAEDAALLGNADEARRLLARAAELDPTSEQVAYRLGRAYEEEGREDEAVHEYCRYLALAPQAEDAAETRQRIVTLASPGAGPVPEPAAVQFRTGLTYLDRGQLDDARRAFDAAIAAHRPFAAAYYDRAFVHVRERDWAAAAQDLERYAELAPGALDRVVAREQAAVLRGAARSPGTAAMSGLLPGGAQIYTGRPVLGGLIGAAAAGALVVAFLPEDELQTVEAVDPNGRPYTYTTTRTTHPRRTLGFSVAGGLLLAGMVEGVVHVLMAQERAEEIRAQSRPLQSTARTSRTSARPLIDVGPSTLAVGVQIGF